MKAQRAALVATLVLAGFFSSGCTSLGVQGKNRQLTVQTSWARLTTKNEFLGFRRMNRMQPLVMEEMIIQANAIDGLVAYRRGSGKQIWRLDLENGVEGGVQAAQGKLFFGASDGSFYSVNANDGKVLWTIQVGAETLAPPTVEGGVVYFQSGADVLYALDAETGKQLWSYNRQVANNLSIRATTRPVVAGNTVLAGFSDGFLVAVRKNDGGLIWERKLGVASRFSDVDATPVVDGTTAYVASYDAALYAVNIETGEVSWTVEEGAYVPVTLGSGAMSDQLYYSTTSGKVLVLDRRSGKQLRAIEIKRGIPTQVSLYKGLIIFGESEGGVIVADPNSGERLAQFYPGNGLVARPTTIEATGEVFAMSNGANLWALKLGYQNLSDLLPWQQ